MLSSRRMVADQCQHHVTGIEVEVIAGAVEIGRHGRDEVGAVLLAVGLAKLDAGDLGDRVPLVGRLQLAGEQRTLDDRLSRELRIDAGPTQEAELLDTGAEGCLNNIGFDDQVIVVEVRRIAIVGEMPPTLAAATNTASGFCRSTQARTAP